MSYFLKICFSDGFDKCIYGFIFYDADCATAKSAACDTGTKNTRNLPCKVYKLSLIHIFEKTVDMLKSDMDELEKEVTEAKNRRAACYNVIDEVQEHLREESVLENTARMNVAQVQREQLESKQRYEGFLKKQKALLQELDEINENEDSIQMELETSEKLEKELNEQIEALQMQLEKELSLIHI